ncbi:MAG: hypothetical protein GFH27_549321n114 [Chloroflexi bacterium AL-W]|nr:hypothetical protein [Chloroflexi bacterium AL-N1]NOK64992.1 hypothetical protein [Chloroflexi bacterium AL-N10]NOK76762.1 hypothetical protein [Chloroflexi bacterium AL-N5]NOK84653.1 hypothetical protein [Chloroflexi bacterium AL-W]NOK86522.1 hypothetical protein [Chloroflexi bacterium AL-N15]
MNEMLMHIIIDQILFLELSDDSIVEPDAAVAQLEQIAYCLQKLDQKEREVFTAYIDQYITTENATNQKRIAVLRSIPDSLFRP